jgi:hypothetical protein
MPSRLAFTGVIVRLAPVHRMIGLSRLFGALDTRTAVGPPAPADERRDSDAADHAPEGRIAR